MDKYQQGRNEGMAYALRIAEKDGVEGLRKEVNARGLTGLNLNISHKELQQATVQMRHQVFDTMLIMAIGVLVERWGFGQKRCTEFMNDFRDATEQLGENFDWDDLRKNIEDHLGMKLTIWENNTDVHVRREY